MDRRVELAGRIAMAQRLIDNAMRDMLDGVRHENWDPLERNQQKVDRWKEQLRELDGK